MAVLFHKGVLIGLLLWGCSSLLFADADEQAVADHTSVGTPPSIGNFSLADSQQPGPLLSFGQTIIDRNQVQLSFDTVSPYHIGGSFDNLNASLTYGISDATALYFNYPIKSDPQIRTYRKSNLIDVTLQLEHAFYTSGDTHYQDQATFVGGLSLPTEPSGREGISRGYGAPTYFVGTTYTRTYVDWQMFVSPGAQITTASNHARLGSQYLYEAGIGHSILYTSGQSLLFGLLEMDGQYTDKDQVFGVQKPNTGGNMILLTPSILFSTSRLMIQVGYGYPVLQDLNGHQKHLDYLIAGNLIWTLS